MWDEGDSDLLDIQQDLVSCDMSVFESWRCWTLEDHCNAIQALYSNAYFVLIRILERACHATTYLADLKKSMRNDGRIEKLEEAESLSDFFHSLGIDKQWDDLHFLSVAISCLPKGEKRTARKVFNHYRSHLRACRRATSIKDREALMKASDSKYVEANLVPLEITIDKNIEDYTWEECVTMGDRFFGVRVRFSSTRPGSTILVFMVPKTLAREIEGKLFKTNVQWMMKELGFCRVQALEMFDKDVTAPISTDNIRVGLLSGVDFISLTEHCSPLMKSLVSSQDISLMNKGKYTGGFYRELTTTKGKTLAYNKGTSRAALGPREAPGKHSALTPTDGAVAHKTFEVQSKEQAQGVIMNPTKDWSMIGECEEVIQHSPGGGMYTAVAVNNEGLLAVTDVENRCVHILTEDGTLVRSIGEGVLGNYLFGVTFDLKGNVWVTDGGNNELFKLSQDGLLLQTIHVACSERDPLNDPCGVSVSPEGLVFICDGGNHRVAVYDEDGYFLFAFGSKGNGPGCFNGPRDIAIGSDGLVYVVDIGNDRVSVWSKEGSFQRDFETIYIPVYIAATSDNHMLITSADVDIVMVYTLEGKLAHQFGRESFASGMFLNQSFLGICTNESDLVYVVDSLNCYISLFCSYN